MTLSRRNFIRKAGGAAFAPSLVGLAACNDLLTTPTTSDDPALHRSFGKRQRKGSGGYGGLVQSVDCPELLVPEGFRVVRISETTKPSQADSGFIVPQALDGMAAFPLRNGNIRLIRNHEIRDGASAASPFGPNAYDMRAGGGTTSLEVRVHRARDTRRDRSHDWDGGRGRGRDRDDRDGEIGEIEVLAEYPSLTGTHVNCAGGPSTWGSWLTCEETTETRDRQHGYVFDVPVSANSPVDPVPLKALGRFVHEAVAVDPRTGFVYLTEDRSYNASSGVGSGFYRFIPGRGTRPSDWADPEAGRLQALAIKGQPHYNTITGQMPGDILRVEWVDIPDPDPANAAEDSYAVFKQGQAGGAAVFQRLEGCWYGDDSVFFNATSGGDSGSGQVWQYRPLGSAQGQRNGSGGQLVLVFESPSDDVLESPDNITVSPRGGLVICEDGGGIQFLRGITRRGDIFDFVEQSQPMAEFCGACYSPDGEVLFFNIQGSTSSTGSGFGATYAMWGPWHEGAL